jgi:ArsR family transcriptional regulator, lead/cadmium/zinc/bismuth-responsive transcriptional repressor
MEQCPEKCIHEEKVAQTIAHLPGEETIRSLAETYKALSDPNRLTIVAALIDDELCVCDLAAVCKISESAVSHQLRALRNLRIVRNRREGKVIYYRLDDDHVRNLIKNSIEHIIGHV